MTSDLYKDFLARNPKGRFMNLRLWYLLCVWLLCFGLNAFSVIAATLPLEWWIIAWLAVIWSTFAVIHWVKVILSKRTFEKGK